VTEWNCDDPIQRRRSIEAALNELWGHHRDLDGVRHLTTEQLIVRIVEMRAEACKETLSLLLDKHAEIVRAALSHRPTPITMPFPAEAAT
jgi:hypothetical protein